MWEGGVGLIDAQKCTFSEGAEIVGTIYTNVHHIPLLDVHMALECIYIRMAIMYGISCCNVSFGGVPVL